VVGRDKRQVGKVAHYFTLLNRPAAIAFSISSFVGGFGFASSRNSGRTSAACRFARNKRKSVFFLAIAVSSLRLLARGMAGLAECYVLFDLDQLAHHIHVKAYRIFPNLRRLASEPYRQKIGDHGALQLDRMAGEVRLDRGNDCLDGVGIIV
jgi:hypothetical protein